MIAVCKFTLSLRCTLSQKKIFDRVMFLHLKIYIFLTEKNQSLADKFNDDAWLAKLVFLNNIFERLIELNIAMEGENVKIIDIGEKISSFKQKFALY